MIELYVRSLINVNLSSSHDQFYWKAGDKVDQEFMPTPNCMKPSDTTRQLAAMYPLLISSKLASAWLRVIIDALCELSV